ncbi:MAG: carbohydrate ABC transporter permease [Firmicutes bacterium]|nr:carbohydrate ABC transporter permease [Candidatus Fiminaster equi]
MTLAWKRRNLNKVNHYGGKSSRIFFSIIFMILGIYAISLIVLLVWAFLTSLKSEGAYINNPFGLPNEGNIFANYIGVFKQFHLEGIVTFFSGSDVIVHEYDANFLDMILNSLIYSGVGSIIQTLVPCCIAYLLAKYDFKFSKVIYFIALLTYIIPIVGNYPSVLVTMQNLGLYDSFIGNFIQKFNFLGMYFFIFYAFFQGVSNSYIEAAELDGANQLQILTRIILPQAKTLILTVITIIFVQLWNDYQTPLLYLPSHPTIAYGVHEISNRATNDPNITIELRDITVKLASSMTLALPVLLLFIFLKEKLMSNLSMGGLKE